MQPYNCNISYLSLNQRSLTQFSMGTNSMAWRSAITKELFDENGTLVLHFQQIFFFFFFSRWMGLSAKYEERIKSCDLCGERGASLPPSVKCQVSRGGWDLKTC